MLFLRTILVFALALALGVIATGQAPTQTPTPVDEAIRISSDLIQIGVLVTNARGEIVRDLKKEDFRLMVDGTEIVPTFFEPARGTSKAAAGKNGQSAESTGTTVAVPRTMVFVVDDLHMSASSMTRTRAVMEKFIANEMQPIDRVAVVATSGVVGFLQQFTNDKDVLDVACERLGFRQKSADDADAPVMNEFDAQAIDRNDTEVTNAFVALTIRYNPGLHRSEALSVVQSRARMILQRIHLYASNTLGALQSAATAAGKLPGRKAVFFFSDGLLLDPGNTDGSDDMRRIASAAAHANVVFYSFDAVGLDADQGNKDPNMSPALALSLQRAESFERGDLSSYVATRTGGKFIHNTNDLAGTLTTSSTEAFQQYVLAWEPADEGSTTFHNVVVTVPSRKDVQVSYQSGYFDRSRKGPVRRDTNASVAQEVVQPPPDPGKVVTSVALTYLQEIGTGPALTATIEVDPASLTFVSKGQQRSADVQLLAVVLNQKGEQEFGFKKLLHATTSAGRLGPADTVKYEYQAPVKPGLYQIRVRAEDKANSRVGTAVGWVRVPDTKYVSASSLLLGEIEPTAAGRERSLVRKVDRRFLRNATLKYLGFVYTGRGNKMLGGNITVKGEVVQAGRSFMIVDGAITPAAGSVDETTFSGELPLASLAPGVYELRVTVTGAADKPLIRRTYFEVR